MNKDLLNIFATYVNILQLFRGDVFSLLQLKNMLLSVDDADCSVWMNHPNIASVKPSILIDGLTSGLLILIVSFKYIPAFYANLKVGRLT